MAWTEITRAQYGRDDLGYASDPRDAGEGALIAPLMLTTHQFRFIAQNRQSPVQGCGRHAQILAHAAYDALPVWRLKTDGGMPSQRLNARRKLATSL